MKNAKSDKSYEKYLDKIEPMLNMIGSFILGLYYILFASIAIYYTVGYMNLFPSVLFKVAISCITSFFLAVFALGGINLYKGYSILVTNKNKRTNRIIKKINSKVSSLMVTAMFAFMACVLSGFTISIFKSLDEFNIALVLVFSFIWVCFIAAFVSVFLKKDDKEK